MNEEEKLFIPELKAALSEMGRDGPIEGYLHLCGEAWRHHVLVKDAKHFFIERMEEGARAMLQTSMFNGRITPEEPIEELPESGLNIVEERKKFDGHKFSEAAAPEKLKVFNVRKKRR